VSDSKLVLETEMRDVEHLTTQKMLFLVLSQCVHTVLRIRLKFLSVIYTSVAGVSSEAFMAVMFKVEIWFVMPCSVVVGYQRFRSHAASIFRVK
jgi:hypothetical protein